MTIVGLVARCSAMDRLRRQFQMTPGWRIAGLASAEARLLPSRSDHHPREFALLAPDHHRCFLTNGGERMSNTVAKTLWVAPPSKREIGTRLCALPGGPGHAGRRGMGSPGTSMMLLDVGDGSHIELIGPTANSPVVGSPAANDPLVHLALATAGRGGCHRTCPPGRFRGDHGAQKRRQVGRP